MKYDLKNCYLVFPNSQIIPNIFQEDLTFEEIKQHFIWKNVHSFIVEAPSDDSNYGDLIFDSIKNCSQGTEFDKQKFLQLLSKTWKYYNKFCASDEILLRVFKFSFKNSESSKFSLVNELRKIYLDDELNIFTQKQINKHATEFAKYTGLSCVCLTAPIFSNKLNNWISYLYLNTDFEITNTVINHELFHYMQNVLKKFILAHADLVPKVPKSTINQYLKQLNLSQDYYNKCLNQYDFLTYIHVDLIDYFTKLINDLHESSGYVFLQNLFKDIETYQDDLFSKCWNFSHNNLLKFLKLIYYGFSDTLWETTKNILLEHFKNK